MRIPEREVGLARSPGSACDAADTLGRFRHWPIPPLNPRVQSCPIRARSKGQTRTLVVTHGTNAMVMTCMSAGATVKTCGSRSLDSFGLGLLCGPRFLFADSKQS